MNQSQAELIAALSRLVGDDKVKADAEAATLTPEMAAIDVDKIRAGMFSQAIGAAG